MRLSPSSWRMIRLFPSFPMPCLTALKRECRYSSPGWAPGSPCARSDGYSSRPSTQSLTQPGRCRSTLRHAEQAQDSGTTSSPRPSHGATSKIVESLSFLTTSAGAASLTPAACCNRLGNWPICGQGHASSSPAVQSLGLSPTTTRTSLPCPCSPVSYTHLTLPTNREV